MFDSPEEADYERYARDVVTLANAQGITRKLRPVETWVHELAGVVDNIEADKKMLEDGIADLGMF